MKHVMSVVVLVLMLFVSLQTIAADFKPAARPAVNVRRESVTTYEYDSLHRLTRVTYADGSRIVYEYDAVGNRTSKVVTLGR